MKGKVFGIIALLTIIFSFSINDANAQSCGRRHTYHRRMAPPPPPPPPMAYRHHRYHSGRQMNMYEQRRMAMHHRRMAEKHRRMAMQHRRAAAYGSYR